MHWPFKQSLICHLPYQESKIIVSYIVSSPLHHQYTNVLFDFLYNRPPFVKLLFHLSHSPQYSQKLSSRLFSFTKSPQTRVDVPKKTGYTFRHSNSKLTTKLVSFEYGLIYLDNCIVSSSMSQSVTLCKKKTNSNYLFTFQLKQQSRMNVHTITLLQIKPECCFWKQ